MFRYLFVFLLVNTSYRSLGNPIAQTVSLLNPLTALSGSCDSAFLTKQIRSQISFCSNISLLAPHSEKELQCLIFFDVNTQLCSAIGAKKLVLPEADYTEKINEEQDMDSLCSLAKDWVFSDLPEFSNYKKAVDKVFKQPLTCGKICGVEDVLSNDVNFFCKYFKWGTDTLNIQVVTTSTQGIAIDNAQLHAAANIDRKPVVSAPSSNDLQDVQIMSGSTESKLNVPTSNAPVQPGPAKADASKSETSSVVNQNSQPSGLGDSIVAEPPLNGNDGTNVDPIEDTGAMPDKELNSDNQPSKLPDNVASKVDSVQKDGNKPDINDVSQNKPDTVLKTDEEKDLLNSGVENPPGKLPGDGEDYPDPEDGKADGDNDTQGGDDGEDTELSDPKIDQKPVKKAETIGFTFNRDQEIYSPNSSQDFPDEDDHFFPFFLTAVIMVVLLYVLYHNKNKVGKVFFGLMLEGRQAGRRRNSRGHAYRRLDTLEQAMSANTTAPPTKIIY